MGGQRNNGFLHTFWLLDHWSIPCNNWYPLFLYLHPTLFVNIWPYVYICIYLEDWSVLKYTYIYIYIQGKEGWKWLMEGIYIIPVAVWIWAIRVGSTRNRLAQMEYSSLKVTCFNSIFTHDLVSFLSDIINFLEGCPLTVLLDRSFFSFFSLLLLSLDLGEVGGREALEEEGAGLEGLAEGGIFLLDEEGDGLEGRAEEATFVTALFWMDWELLLLEVLGLVWEGSQYSSGNNPTLPFSSPFHLKSSKPLPMMVTTSPTCRVNSNELADW